MKIARVFPTKTNMCPTDQDVYFDTPDMFTPDYDEIHISVTFTWDIPKLDRLRKDWEKKGTVKVGGVAINGESDKPFKAGMYLRNGVTITSRGCPNKCPFCLVKQPLIEFDEFPEGNVIQDNNILACSDRHLRLVFDMLKNQSQIEFKGGLESERITPKVAGALRSLKIKSLWLACDMNGRIKPLKKAVEILNRSGFTRNHLFCYVLIGKEEQRLREVFEIGCIPFAQLYENGSREKNKYTREMRSFQRLWSRPAITKSLCR